MKFCVKCGTKLKDNDLFCHNCGNEAEKSPLNESTKKLLCIISYIGIFWLVGLLVPDYKENKTVRFHVGQGIILFIAGVVEGIIVAVLKAVFAIITIASFGFLSGIFGLIEGLISLGLSILLLYIFIKGIINAVNQKEEPLPFIGKLAFYK